MIRSLLCFLVNTILAVSTQLLLLPQVYVAIERRGELVQSRNRGRPASTHSVCPWKVATAGVRALGYAEIPSSSHWNLSSLLGRQLSFKENIPTPCHLLISRLCDCTTNSPLHKTQEGGSAHYVIRGKAATHRKKLQSTTYHLVKRHAEI